MPNALDLINGHRRASSSSTVRATKSGKAIPPSTETLASTLPTLAALWVHDDSFSPEEILINPAILSGTRIVEGNLIELCAPIESTDVLDFEENAVDSDGDYPADKKSTRQNGDQDMVCLCIVKFASPEMITKHQGLELSLTKTIAEAFKMQSRTRVIVKSASLDQWTASHIELSFRDAYIARSDMWRLVSLELANKVVYVGQKISFLGTLKLTVKDIHIKGKRVSTGLFSGTTIPIFRSEAARYVLFIQMSREMWDFDSEGNGEIMFNRVINGFLPDLFRRWVQLEVRHLVSIVMFGRLEYDRHDFVQSNLAAGTDQFSSYSSASTPSTTFYQDFFRVVVTDMASAQWATILNELKKDFRVFLRDISLFTPVSLPPNAESGVNVPKITGRPSTALKGNILEAINLASSQFANDYIDRDLVRTGVSTIVITAGTGVFDVDRDLLNLTSENLTNNGIGIDIVCLSKMPLHSVPLFRYRLPQSVALSRVDSNYSHDSQGLGNGVNRAFAPAMDQSSALSSFTGTSVNYFSRFPSAFPSKYPQMYGYGIPHWIDLSYWSPPSDSVVQHRRRKATEKPYHLSHDDVGPFVPRVRMYQLQMMGLMELGMADISIPYVTETSLHHKFPRHQPSGDLTQLSTGKSLSQSPSYFRKVGGMSIRQRESTAQLTHRDNFSNDNFEKMAEYDESIFLEVSKPKPKKKKKRKPPESKNLTKTETGSKRSPSFGQSQSVLSEKNLSTPTKTSTRSSKSTVEHRNKIDVKPKAKANPPRISRSISYALRGLMTPLHSSAASDTASDNIKALPAMATTSLTQANAATPSAAKAESIRNVDVHDSDSRSIRSSDSATERISKPISIGSSSYRPVSQQVSHKLEKPLQMKNQEDRMNGKHSRLWVSTPEHTSEDEDEKESKSLGFAPDSVPQSTLPFIRNVNASNPLKRRSKTEQTFGRWQHLYPHKPHTSTVKWRSLCTPASVPLTTEDFPTAKELSEDYDIKDHRVSIKRAQDASDSLITQDALLTEMIVLRLSHGYQIVVGEIVRKAIGNSLCDNSVFLDPAHLSSYGDSLLMYMGNTIQKLSFSDSDYIQVTKYTKKDVEVEHPFAPSYNYHPNIRTILATEYLPRSMLLKGFSEEYPWEEADNYLANGETNTSNKVNKLRFWRARFAFLPVEPPSNSKRLQQNNDDNDEEIHLLGIRALTQMWQKARYFSPSERTADPGRMNLNRKRDQNPLEIKFDTLNPSELVATELDKLLALEELGEVAPTQLLPDAERLDRNTSMLKIAQAIQSEKGIEIKNRRWHWRLHYNCFNGEEFTNWLLHNVKNIETREEAVQFGNQLMKEGLFEHVNGKPDFRDGVYFYSLKPEFKVPRIDLKSSWFQTARRSDRSVPPTPLSENPVKELPQITTRSRSGSNLAFTLNPSTPLDSSRVFLEKRKKTVTLTKMIKIDVDPRKRSNRREIVNLHYDRTHNPENCYHIELSWLNTTSKLVDEAVVAWTTQAEKYGLKLVEVPIAEVCRIPDSEPFRRAFEVKLVLEPPKRQPVSHILTSSSFTPQPSASPDEHIYHKAILKKFNFVLDLEGSSEFPDNVDVQYSSTSLEYRWTQYVHRSGVCLAQITDQGHFLLLANRLYNARFTNSKEAYSAKYDSKKEHILGPGFSHRQPVPSTNSTTPYLPGNNHNGTSLQASGIIGLNMQSPQITSVSSPQPAPQATADVLGSRAAFQTSTIAQFVTPEQIKDDLIQFCNDTTQLEQFYREFSATSTNSSASTQPPSGAIPRRGNGTSSSALKPIQDANEGIPEFILPESVTTPSSTFGTLGLGGLISRRARPSVAYESVAEMFSRAAHNERSEAVGGGATESLAPGTGRTSRGSGDVSGRSSGHLDLQVRVNTPGGTQRIEEGIEEGMHDSIGSLGSGNSKGTRSGSGHGNGNGME